MFKLKPIQMNKKVLISAFIMLWLGFSTAFAEDIGPNIMLIHDVEAPAGDIITIEVEIINADAFVGFNLDVPIPEGFTYVDGTAQLFRKTDHMLVFNVLPTNVAKIMGFSIMNSEFIGNEGIVVSFDVQTPDTPGEYVFAVVDAVIGNIDAQDILTGTEDGTVTLFEAGDFDLTLAADPIEGGTVEGEGTYTGGTPVTITATPNDEWLFANWTDDDGNVFSTNAEHTFNMPFNDLNLTANFVPDLPFEGYIMKIHDVTASVEEVVTIELEIMNEGDFVGFSLQLPIPEGFNYVDESATLFRGTDHELEFVVVDHVAHITATSENNESFEDFEGVMLSFDLVAPLLPGTYSLNILEPEILDADQENVLTDSEDGHVFLTGNIMMIHDIEADAGDVVTVELEIFNYDQFGYFDLEIPVPHMFEVVEGSAQLFRGSATHQFEFNVLANNVVSINAFSLLGDFFEGNQGVIFSFDLQTPDNILGSFPLEIHSAEMWVNLSTQINILDNTIDGTLFLEGDPDNTMKIHDVEEAIAGDVVNIEMEIMNNMDFTEFSLEIPLPAGFSYVDDTAELFRKTDHELDFEVIENVITIHASSPGNQSFTGNQGVILSFDLLTADDVDGEVVLEIINAEILDAFGNDVLTETIDGTITLFFNLTLTASPTAGGTVSEGGLFNAGDLVEIEAVANIGYEFINWTDADGETVSDDAAFTYTMPSANVHLTANFLRLEFEVEVVINPEDGGEVEGAGLYFYNQRVTLIAQPSEGWTFVNYTDADGNELSDEPEYEFFMPLEDVLVNANFELVDYTLTLIAEPEEGGNVTGAGVYNFGDEVHVDAIPSEGWEFVNWTDLDGNVVSEEEFNIIEMPAADLTLIANFEMIDYILTLVAEPEEGGEVTGEGVYNVGDQVEIEAFPNEGWAFVNWTDIGGNVVSVDPLYSLTMPAQDYTFTAHFEMADYTLTLVAEPEEGGEVTGAGVYNFGDEVEVDAIPNEGYIFVNWTDLDGNVVSEEAFNVIEMPAGDLTLIANFELDVSVIETEVVTLNIFPNPASSIMTIESSAIITSLRLIDMLGQVVYHTSLNDHSYEINVANFRNGVYFVQINTSAGLSTERVQIVQ